MNGTLMWIILGSLIGLVVIFLVITSFLDKKKQARMRVEKKELDIEIISSTNKTIENIKTIIKTNEESLKSFIVSVGDKKMSDINNAAKNSLTEIKNSRGFRLIKNNEDIYEDLNKHISDLISTKSNMWEKRNLETLKYFNDFVPLEIIEEVIEEPKDKKSNKNKKDSKNKKDKK